MFGVRIKREKYLYFLNSVSRRNTELYFPIINYLPSETYFLFLPWSNFFVKPETPTIHLFVLNKSMLNYDIVNKINISSSLFCSNAPVWSTFNREEDAEARPFDALEDHSAIRMDDALALREPITREDTVDLVSFALQIVATAVANDHCFRYYYTCDQDALAGCIISKVRSSYGAFQTYNNAIQIASLWTSNSTKNAHSSSRASLHHRACSSH